MIRVGLTGNAGAGKSTVGRAWAEAGVPVIDADLLAREVVAPGTEGLREVVAAFGRGVLGPDGALDREALRDRVFRDPALRRRLEAILHPRIARRRAGWEEARRREGARVVVSEVPLLFEAGLEGAFDVVVFVDAPEEERMRRLQEGRGLEPDEARRILASQGDPAAKRDRADHVLSNAGSIEELRGAAMELLDRLRSGADG